MPPLIEEFEIKKIDGKLIFTDFGGYESRNPSTFWSINEADKQYNWKDFDTIKIYTADCQDSENNYSYSKYNSYNNLVPDFHFHCWKEVGMDDYENFIKNIDDEGKNPYEINKVGWVGSSASSDNRKLLLNIAKDNKKLFDFFENKWTRSSTIVNNSTNYIHTSDLVRKYSILIDIEGYGYSGRFKHLLWSHRPVLMVDRPYTEYFFEFLKEWEHYIPVKRDLSDLVEKTKWCMENYDKALEIAKNAYEFSKIYLTREACYGWWNYTICNSNQYITMRALEDERAKVEAYELELLEKMRLEQERLAELERIKVEETEKARIVRMGAAKLATARMLEAAKTKATIEANIAAEKAKAIVEAEKKIIKIIETITVEADNIATLFSTAVKNEAKNIATELMNTLKIDKPIITKTKTFAKETAKKVLMSKNIDELRIVTREVSCKIIECEKNKFFSDIIKAEKALAAEKNANKMIETITSEADNIAFQIMISVTNEAKHISTELMNSVNKDNSVVTTTTETSKVAASNILKAVDIEVINVIIRNAFIEIASKSMFNKDDGNNSNEVCGDTDTCN